MPKEEFKQEIERELTGKETEPWEIIYFKLYQSQIPVIERGDRDGSSDARKRPVSRLLSGNDLCGLSGRGQPWITAIRDACFLDDDILQVSAPRAEAGIPRRPERKGNMSRTNPALAAGSGAWGTDISGSPSFLFS